MCSSFCWLKFTAVTHAISLLDFDYLSFRYPTFYLRLPDALRLCFCAKHITHTKNPSPLQILTVYDSTQRFCACIRFSNVAEQQRMFIESSVASATAVLTIHLTQKKRNMPYQRCYNIFSFVCRDFEVIMSSVLLCGSVKTCIRYSYYISCETRGSSTLNMLYQVEEWFKWRQRHELGCEFSFKLSNL